MGFGAGGEEDNYEAMKEKLSSQLKEKFRPEFLNRLDDVIVFRKLTKSELGKIVELMLADTRKRLAQQNIKLIIGDDAREFLVNKGYDETYGARPLRRAIQRFIEDQLAEEILGKKVKKGATVNVVVSGNSLVFKEEVPKKTKTKR